MRGEGHDGLKEWIPPPRTAWTLGGPGGGEEEACTQQHRTWGWGARTHRCAKCGPSRRGDVHRHPEARCKCGRRAHPWTTAGGGQKGTGMAGGWEGVMTPWRLAAGGVSG